jgi:hypothetical protein
MLRNVYRLNIGRCDGIEDISALNIVRYLYISELIRFDLKKGLSSYASEAVVLCQLKPSHEYEVIFTDDIDSSLLDISASLN